MTNKENNFQETKKNQKQSPTIDKQKQTLALEALSADGFLMINKKLASHFGLELAGYISNLVDKYKYFQKHGKLDTDMSFFLTHSDQCVQIGITERRIRKHKKTLKDLGILNTKMRGVPPKEFYILDINKLISKFLNPNPDETVRNNGDETVRNNGDETVRNNGDETVRNNGDETVRNIKDNKYKDNKYKDNKYKDTNNIISENSDNEQNQSNEVNCPYEKIKKSFHKYCPSLPKVKILSEQRKTTIKARWKQYDYQLSIFKELFIKTEKSDFLSGKSKAWTKCDFDWLLKEANMTKVLEGKYDNKQPSIRENLVDPKELIKQEYSNKELDSIFYDKCYILAKEVFQLDSSQLAEALIDLEIKITTEQNKLRPNIRQLLPGSIQLVIDYVKWLDAQTWINDYQPSMLGVDSRLFSKFRRHQAKADSQERDPMTGRSYL